METEAIGTTPYPFKGEGDSVIGKPRFEAGRVWINDTQYFDGVTNEAWNFFIGGYQPAQKWLKDRRQDELTWNDIRHYQKIIKVLSETHRIMQELS